MKRRILQILFIFSSTFIFNTSIQANICLNITLPEHSDYIHRGDIRVESFDSTIISGNLFTPKSQPPAAGFPLIIFVNSWVLDEHEYLVQAAQFAKKGYMVFSYSSRGWGCSGGMVNVVGEKDMQDLSAIVDWFTAQQPIDPDNIGISGISYGSGISLMGLAKEPRIKTAVAMSTWASLTDSLYQHQTPRAFWGFFLVSSGLITANLDPVVADNYLNLLFNKDIPQTIAWSESRSVGNVINLINERNAPVYLANNFGDNLFQPNNLLKFYSQLTVPKRIDLNQGTHASGEGFGLVGLDNYTWNNTHRWFDHWLKGEDNGIADQKPVTMLAKVPADSNFYQRQEFADWPLPTANEETFYLKARGVFSNGGLSSQPYTPWWTQTNRIYSGLDTFATTGIPLLSAILDGHLATPVKTSMSFISRLNGIVFESGKLDHSMKIRGIPKIHLNITPSYPKMQLNAYLYDVSGDIGTLITHGPVTLYQADTGSTNSIDWELVATAYDIPKGHKLAIAFDTFDILYGVPTVLPYSVAFKFKSNQQSEIKLPVVP
jgi:predicted acyl esterase